MCVILLAFNNGFQSGYYENTSARETALRVSFVFTL